MLWGCRHGWQHVRPDPGSGRATITQRCVAEPAYLPGMPTRASHMRSYLNRKFGPGLRSAAVPKVAEVLLDQNYLRPAQRAALYNFFTTIRGMKVVSGIRDYIGRPGVGVEVTTGGFTAIWIFDSKTYAFLGTTELVNHKVSFASAVVKVAIVDKAGRRP